ncbi:MAG: TolC family protein [Thermodesulfobacteriota bacterium]
MMRFISKSLSFVFWVSSVVAVLTAVGTATPDKNYQALSLEDCLALAREKNPVLGASREKVNELVADYQAARSKFFPKLTLISYYQRIDPERLSPGGGATAQSLFGREGLTSLTGKQLVFDGLKTYYNTKAATFGKKAQQQEVFRTADEVAFQVTEAFYRLMEAKEDVQVAETALQERRKFLEITEAFFRAGKVTRVDAYKARSQVLEAEQGQVEANNAVRLAKEILARTLGLKDKTPIDIRGRLPQKFIPASNFDSLWQRAEDTNPELKRLKLELAQGQALIKAARGGYFPEVNLQAATGVRHRDVGGTREEWLGGVFMEFPFFEGGLTRAQVAKASSQYRQLLDKRRDRLDALRVELMTGWKDQENARQGVAASRQNVTTSEEAYQSALALYRVGKATGLDVLTAEVELTRARLSLIHYQAAYEIGRAKVKQIIGGGATENEGKKPRQGEEK